MRPDSPAAGIDFGFKTLVTLSAGEKIANPRECQTAEARIAQANRGHNHKLVGRVHQRAANARRCRNHAISRDLLTRFSALYLSRDNYPALARTKCGKSVNSAGIYRPITMLHDKGRSGGRRVIEVRTETQPGRVRSAVASRGPSVEPDYG